MYKVIIPKFVVKELAKIEKRDRQLVFDKIKSLKRVVLPTTKRSKANIKESFANGPVIIGSSI